MMCSSRCLSNACLATTATLMLLPLGAVLAFHHPPSILPSVRNYATHLGISPFGGSGWDNDDFLSSLSEPYDEDNDGSTELTRSMEPSAQQQQQQYQQQQYQQQTDPAALAAATEALGRDQSAISGYGAGYGQQQQQPTQAKQSQVQKQEVGALPLGWSAHFDPESRQLYYYNVNDGTTQWERPASPPPPPPLMNGGGTGGSAASGGTSGNEDAAMFGGGQQMPMQQPSQARQPFGGPQPQITPGAASLPPDEARNAEEVPIDESIDGAELTADMKAKIKASHTEEEEASGGGQRFKQMMERAKQQAAASGGAGAQQQTSAPMAAQLPPDAANLPLDEQARLYREMFWRQKNPQVENYPKPQYQMNGLGIDGRKIGRNRDSDMISNTGDVYMAQLKRDSTARNLARYAGDDAKANSVFHDAAIDDIKGPEENPYLKERRERERDMLETVPEEMLLFQEYDRPGDNGAGAAGQNQQVSYRDRLRQAQEQKRSQQ